MKTLRDWMMDEYFDSHQFDKKYVRLNKMLDIPIVKDSDELSVGDHMIWPEFKEKNIQSWVELENGWCVAFNENVSRGWSFPFKKLPLSPRIKKVQTNKTDYEFQLI